MSLLRNIISGIIIYVLVSILFSFSFLLFLQTDNSIVEFINDQGFVIKNPLTKSVYVFAHGNFKYTTVKTNNQAYFLDGVNLMINTYEDYVYHVTYFGGRIVKTKNLIETFRQQGYKKIWLSMCHTGDESYVMKRGNKVWFWGDDVVRNEREGLTVPIFYGFGFIYL